LKIFSFLKPYLNIILFNLVKIVAFKNFLVLKIFCAIFTYETEIVPFVVEIRDRLLIDYSIKKLKSQEIFEKNLRFF